MKKFLAVLTTVFTIVCMAVPAFAYTIEEIPSADDFWDKETYPYAILQSVNEIYWELWLCSTKPYIDGNNVEIPDATTGMAYYRYTLNAETGEWKVNDPSYSSSGIGLSKTYVVDSNFDIYDKSGNVAFEGGGDFFTPPPPLAELVLEVTEEELVTVAIPEMVGAMKVLVPCGVGLMALLVGLSLFGKRSLLFLR